MQTRWKRKTRTTPDMVYAGTPAAVRALVLAFPGAVGDDGRRLDHGHEPGYRTQRHVVAACDR